LRYRPYLKELEKSGGPIIVSFTMWLLVRSREMVLKSTGAEMKYLIKRIAQSLVDHPEQVEVTEVHGSTVTVIELKVAKEDMGQAIGKKGRNAAAIRTGRLEKVEEEGGVRDH
jgi:predicted RNA-binding protein YlqC (UPF0109 family)